MVALQRGCLPNGTFPSLTSSTLSLLHSPCTFFIVEIPSTPGLAQSVLSPPPLPPSLPLPPPLLLPRLPRPDLGPLCHLLCIERPKSAVAVGGLPPDCRPPWLIKPILQPPRDDGHWKASQPPKMAAKASKANTSIMVPGPPTFIRARPWFFLSTSIRACALPVDLLSPGRGHRGTAGGTHVIQPGWFSSFIEFPHRVTWGWLAPRLDEARKGCMRPFVEHLLHILWPQRHQGIFCRGIVKGGLFTDASPPLERRRIVVTGLGIITHAGVDAQFSWKGMLSGASAVEARR